VSYIVCRYKWRATSCAEEHTYICSLRRPNCPRGYTFRITINNQGGTNSDSCFKVKGPSHLDWNSIHLFHHHVSLLDDMCKEDGTRLAVPGSNNQMINIIRWLSDEEPTWMTGPGNNPNVSLNQQKDQ
jgi:hypothetical protein